MQGGKEYMLLDSILWNGKGQSMDGHSISDRITSLEVLDLWIMDLWIMGLCISCIQGSWYLTTEVPALLLLLSTLHTRICPYMLVEKGVY